MEIKFKSNISLTSTVSKDLSDLLKTLNAKRVFWAVDTNTCELCAPLLQSVSELSEENRIVIPSGEEAKNIETLSSVWKFLCDHKADRKSILINLGGGMLSDLCGFAASTFKRGIPFINIPTTLLSQVDASVGGKTGIDFNGLKNEIGVFSIPRMVFIDTLFLRTLDSVNFLSGYAEMIKHGLIYNADHWNELQSFNFSSPDLDRLRPIIGHSVLVKEHFVLNDPTEQNIRKALNFGHTIGHAFESHAIQKGKPILHGYAVAYGIAAELYLSCKYSGFPLSQATQIAQWIISLYGRHEITTTEFDDLIRLMTHDKKNENGKINFTLIPEIGQFKINCNCPIEAIRESLEFFQQINR